MNYKLIQDMFYAAPEFWIISVAVIVFGTSFFYTRILKLKRRNYFLNRDRERYAETLYALKDGYFAFIYPDKRVNDYRRGIREHCSRRLAVMLNLKNGKDTPFNEVLEQFYKEDAKKIQKYLTLLRDEGVMFEDAFRLKNIDAYITLTGSRINGYDGNVYCDVVWFRDITTETGRIMALESAKTQDDAKIMQFETLINGIAYPVYLRDEKLNIILANKKYTDLLSLRNKGNANASDTDLIPQNLALIAQSTNKVQKQNVNMVIDGSLKYYDCIETPAYENNNLQKICTVGSIIDVSELDEIKRNLKLHQNVHLQVLSMLGTAFGVFDKDYKLSFYNDAFMRLWDLEKIFLDSQPTYLQFLDVLREKRLLPEVPDFKGYREEEMNQFNSLIENKEDMMHLPDGRTFRRVRAPQPSGGLIFAFEDVSDRLATRRAYNLQQETQEKILEQLTDAALVFGSNGRLKQYNSAYVKLWNITESQLENSPTLADIVDMQKQFFAKTDNWPNLRKFIIDKILSNAYQTVRADGVEITARCVNLPDDSILILYKNK